MMYSVGKDIKPVKVRIYHFLNWTMVLNGNSFSLWNNERGQNNAKKD